MPGVPSLYYGDEAGMQGFADPFNRKFFPWGKEDKELISWYKKLGEIRAEYSAFNDGEVIEIYSSDNCYIFERKNNDCEVLIGVNLNGKEVVLEYDGVLKNLLNDEDCDSEFVLKPQSCCVLVKRQKNS